MEVLVPRFDSRPIEAVLPEIAAVRPMLPFAEVAVDFIDAVSKRVLSDPAIREWTELLAVAHWMRRAHLLEMQRAFTSDGRLRLARGIVVHFAPSNVDTIFLYSWLISLLAGNLNVIRISSSRRPQLDCLLSILNEVFDQPRFCELRARNAVVSYEHDEETTRNLCSFCVVRVLWGGDHTVSSLRQVQFPPLATELAFPDRFSLAAFRAQAVNQASEQQLSTLIHRFFADTFSFDQMACSSPRLVLWIGTASEIEVAKERFWPAFRQYVSDKHISYPSAIGINRLAAVYAYAGTGQADKVDSDWLMQPPVRVQLSDTASDFREVHSGAGLFLEKDCDSLSDVATILTAKDQTLSYFGYSSSELADLAKVLPARSIDRIVPVGRALEFSPTWDGVDLFHAFTRCVEIW
jgi:hypothetical protein